MEEPSYGNDVPWWRSAVFYQVYIRSFADSNADGVGDLKGVIDHLDHLEWLGVDAIWLSPVTVSPNADWGYDVSDFYAVDPSLGTMEELDQLVAECSRRAMRVLLDLVPNHTSDQHPWFLDSRSSPTAAHRGWYVWAPARSEGEPPNNWVSGSGGPAWSFDPVTDEYFLHNHLPQQPDLNWWNEDVRNAFDDVMRFWLERGIAGFRIDVCNIIIKDKELRDNPPATPEDDLDVQLLGQRFVYNANRPEVHEVIRRWRRLADSYELPRLLIGETPVDIDALAGYYGDGSDELNLSFNFPFINASLSAPSMRQVVEATIAKLPDGAWPAWTGSNHDMSRFSTRWAHGDLKRARLALFMLLSVGGTPVLYQGDEIGLCDFPVPREDLRDPLGVMYFPAYEGRDAMRTPMPWNDGPGAGFTEPGTKPWLPLSGTDRNVEDQRSDSGSILWMAHDLMALRRTVPELAIGDYVPMDLGSLAERVWAWGRGREHFVVLNMGEESVELDAASGTILMSTDRSRDGAELSGALEIGGWQGVILEGAFNPHPR
jgi:alpha-glucosidase